MIDISFDDNYDMTLENADIAFTNDDNYLEQKLKAKLQLIKDEWFLDITAGVPYPQVIFAAKTSLADIYAIFRREILEFAFINLIISRSIESTTSELVDTRNTHTSYFMIDIVIYDYLKALFVVNEPLY